MAGGVVASSSFPLLLEPKLRKVFFEAYTEVEEQYSKVFKVKSSTKAVETDYHMAGVGMWEEKESMGAIAYETIESGLTATYTHKEYAKGIQVERKFIDDEMYNQIEKLPKSIARKGRATVEVTAAAVLNNAGTTNGYDGVPLVSDSHPLVKSASLGDNSLGDAPLNDVNLKAALLLARKTVDETGIIISGKPSKLIVPPDLEFTALTLLQSTLLVGSANNDKNVIQNRLSPVVLDYLTNAYKWFTLDESLSELNFFWRVRPEFNRETDTDTLIHKFLGYFRFSVGYSDWRGIIGSAADSF